MAHRVFVSYKYLDDKVGQLLPYDVPQHGTARDYVDLIMQTIADTEIYNGEDGDNDLSEFSDESIKTHLKELIRNSSITIVLVSKAMKDESKAERDQWIPWEIQYSLTRRAYGERRTKRNGMLAVILPDEDGSYAYYSEKNPCLHCNTTNHKIEDLFDMLHHNMFNLNEQNTISCISPAHYDVIHTDSNHSYIHPVLWEDFIAYPSSYIDLAEQRKDQVDSYNLKLRLAS